MNELDEIAIVRGNLDEANRNMFRITEIIRETEDRPWRVLRNRKLLTQARVLLKDNRMLLAVNERLLR